MEVLIIDNNDSFTYNLAQLVQSSGQCRVKVVKYDEVDTSLFREYKRIIISPGPGLPEDYPLYREWITEIEATHKILGICMGHEIIACHYGGFLKRLEIVQHGIVKRIEIDTGNGLFNGLIATTEVGLYHSWIVEQTSLPAVLSVTARDNSGNIMGLRHMGYEISSVQFHPESYMTGEGGKMIVNWLSY